MNGTANAHAPTHRERAHLCRKRIFKRVIFYEKFILKRTVRPSMKMCMHEFTQNS